MTWYDSLTETKQVICPENKQNGGYSHMHPVIQDLNRFLESNETEKEFRFKDGFFLSLKKHSQKAEPFLEIHTSGYDDTLKLDDAVEWIKWKLIDLQANSLL